MFNVWDKSTTITQLVSTNFALVEKNAKYSVVRIIKNINFVSSSRRKWCKSHWGSH